MTTIHFTSDLHLGHRLVAGIRGFDSVEEHDAAVAESWRKVVSAKDQVWVLGDLAVSSPAKALAIIDSLPGEKHLIWGNHDGGHPMHRDSHRRARQYLEVFASAQVYARRRISGAEVLVSHFPYAGDTDGRAEDRHGQHRLPNHGVPIIHGHTHSASRVTFAGDSRQIHVGWDAWRAPVPIHTIEEMLK